MGTHPLGGHVDSNALASTGLTPLRRVVLAPMIGVALLPAVARSATPCASDLEKFRSNVPVGGGWILAQEMSRLAAICRFDILRFCWDVSPGHGRVARCVSRIEPISHRSGGRPSVPRTGNRGLPPINARR